MLIVEFLAILYIPEMEEDENFAVLEDWLNVGGSTFDNFTDHKNLQNLKTVVHCKYSVHVA